MRNGNLVGLNFGRRWCPVLTVPMRNGNQLSLYQNFTTISFSSYRTYEEWKRESCIQCEQGRSLFLPYLWGMETIPEWFVTLHKRWVLTVPMRNGNCYYALWYYMLCFVLTVPMRNGNFVCYFLRIHCYLGSYRTYEEWKLVAIIRLCSRLSSSYRTYEEWKQFGNEATCRIWTVVLTVPMRNGNNLQNRPYFLLQRFLPYLWGMETVN